MRSYGKIVLLVAAIVAIAGVFRLYQLPTAPPGLYPDEAMNGSNALEALHTGAYKIFYPENNGREGLFINIQAVFLSSLLSATDGLPEPWMLRFPSTIFGTLTVLGLFLLTRELLRGRPARQQPEPQAQAGGEPSGERLAGARDRVFSKANPDAVALLAAFLLATSFWHINFSRIGFRAIMAPFFLTWGLYFLIRSLRGNEVTQAEGDELAALPEKSVSEPEWAWRPEDERGRPARQQPEPQALAGGEPSGERPAGAQDRVFSKARLLGLATLAGILYGLGFYSYIAYRATPLLVLLILWLSWREAKRRQATRTFVIGALVFVATTVLVATPLGLYFASHPADFLGRTSQISIFSSPTPVKDLTLNTVKTLGMFNVAGDGNWRHNIAGRPLLFWPVGVLFLLGVLNGIRILSSRGTHARTVWIPFTWLAVAALPVIVSNEGLPHALRAILMAPPVFMLAGWGGVALYEFLKRRIGPAQRYLPLGAAAFLVVLTIEGYHSYFIRWAKHPEVAGAFAANYAAIGRYLRSLPREMPKYIVIEAGGTDVRGIPMPAQTVMFLTDTFRPEDQVKRNFRYLLPSERDQIPPGGLTVTIK